MDFDTWFLLFILGTKNRHERNEYNGQGFLVPLENEEFFFLFFEWNR